MSVSLDIPIAEPKLWSPESPNLYPICLELHSADGVDRVNTYTGLRTIEVRDEHLYLNGERLFFRGALDQGYWPETGYTAPDDNALHKDVLLALDAGYNLIRKHIKLEDPRWLYWADREGLLVWAEPPCIGRYSQEAVARFEAQLKPMVERDGSHPCIILWGIYNEEWGLDWRCAEVPEYQEAVERAYDLLSVLDPERPIIDNSGWWHVKTDVVDWHYYDEDMVTWKSITAAIAGDRSAVFGHRLSDTRWYETRLSIDDRDHSRLPLVNGEYGGGRPSNQGWLFRWQTQDLRLYDVFDGYIYTELYDVEHEIVGIYTADRILKDLGCIPAAINSDTLIIFDITPIAPGVDMVQADGVFQIPIRISHHAASKLHTRLCWGWQPGQMSGSVSVNAEPYATSPAMVINVELPFELTMARLYMWLEGYELCANVIDLARNHSS